MASKSRCVIKAINDLEQKVIRWSVSLRVVGKKSFLIKESLGADRAKILRINIKLAGRAQTSQNKKMATTSSPLSFPQQSAEHPNIEIINIK